jgi:hypothetical protein
MAQANVMREGPYRNMKATIDDMHEASMTNRQTQETGPLATISSDNTLAAFASFADVSSDSDDDKGFYKQSQTERGSNHEIHEDITSQEIFSHRDSELGDTRPPQRSNSAAMRRLATDSKEKYSDPSQPPSGGATYTEASGSLRPWKQKRKLSRIWPFRLIQKVCTISL